ncbi:hypothetical protein BH23PAT2_BH23PAT2_02640 [soil metagenome]
MTKRDYCQVWLSCADNDEADKISHTLLERHLIACAKRFPVNSSYWWQKKIDNADETLLLMETKESLFDEIEAEVAKLHSYDTFVLYATPLVELSKRAVEWMGEETHGG